MTETIDVAEKRAAEVKSDLARLGETGKKPAELRLLYDKLLDDLIIALDASGVRWRKVEPER